MMFSIFCFSIAVFPAFYTVKAFTEATDRLDYIFTATFFTQTLMLLVAGTIL